MDIINQLDKNKNRITCYLQEAHINNKNPLDSK